MKSKLDFLENELSLVEDSLLIWSENFKKQADINLFYDQINTVDLILFNVAKIKNDISNFVDNINSTTKAEQENFLKANQNIIKLILSAYSILLDRLEIDIKYLDKFKDNNDINLYNTYFNALNVTFEKLANS